MSNLDVYCISHYDEKQFFTHMSELGLTLDPKDFATNRYQVDEQLRPPVNHTADTTPRILNLSTVSAAY